MILEKTKLTRILSFLREWRMQIFSTLVYVVVVGVLIALTSQNLFKSLFLLIVMSIWLFTVFKFKSLLLSNTLLLLGLLPYNLAIQLSKELLGFEIANFYVSGVKISTLIPTLAVIDLVLVIATISFFIEFNPIYGLRKVLSKKWLWISTLSYYLMHNLYFADCLVFVKTTRLLLFYSVAFLALMNWEYVIHTFKSKQILFLRILILINIFIQFLMSITQFVQGRSLGLNFLGESNLVKGFYGTSWIDLGGKVYLRSYGTFPHPNVLGGFLSLTLIYALSASWRRLRERSQRGFILHLITAIIVSFNVLLTFSRTAIVSSATTWLLFAIGTVFDFRKILRVYRARILEKRIRPHKRGNFAMVFNFGLIIERFKSLYSSGKVSWLERVKLAKTAVMIILEHPLFGVGAGKFVQAIGQNVALSSGGHYLFEPVHNIYLLLLAEHGIVFGGVAVVIILVIIVSSLRKTFDLIYERPVLVFGEISIAVWFLLISNIDHYLVTLPQGLALFAVFLAFQIQFFRIKPRHI